MKLNSKSNRQNWIYFLAITIALIFYLNEIEVIQPLYYTKGESPDYLKATMKFVLWNVGIVTIYYLNKNKQIIIDKAYDLYEKNEVYEEEIYRNPKKYNQDAVKFIELKYDGFFDFSEARPLTYYGDRKYKDLIRNENLVIRNSRPYNFVIGAMMIVIPIILALQIDYSKVEGVFYVYAFSLICIILSIHSFYKFFNNPILFEFNNNGLLLADKLFGWSEIEFGYLNLHSKQCALLIKVVNVDNPIRVYFDLENLNYSRKVITHSFEYFRRKYSDKLKKTEA